MQVVAVHQRRMVRIAPRLGIEMQAEHKIRLQLVVYQAGAAPDFAVAIKEQLSLPAHRLFFLRIGRAIEILPRLRDPGVLEKLPGRLLEIRRPIWCDRLRVVAQQRHLRA